MDKLLIFTGESIVLTGIFYGAYWLVLRKGINHRLSRFYLLTSIVLGIILPLHLFNFSFTGKHIGPEKTITIVANAKLNYQTMVTSIANVESELKNNLSTTALPVGPDRKESESTNLHLLTHSILNKLLWVYFIGIALLLIRFLTQLRGIYQQISSQKTEKEGEITFVCINEKCSPYSFGKYLFAPQLIKNTPEFTTMVEHEKAHIRQKHTYDVLFIELATAFIWINPFVWLIRNSLRKVHEYLADEQVIKNGYNSIDYQALLLEKIISPQTIGLTSTFHFKPLNQRLAMIKNLSKTIPANIRLLKGIPALTVVVLSLAIGVIISCSGKQERAFQLVKIQGNYEFFNFSTSNIGYILSADSVTPTSMLVQSGDVIGANDDMVYHQNETSYHFSSNVDGVILNKGKVFSIKLSNKPEMGSWLKQLDTIDLSALDHIELGEELPSNFMDYLSHISKNNQKIGLNIYKWNEEMPDVIKMFTPNWMSIIGWNMHQVTQLAPLPELELLVLSINDVQIYEPLPTFPKLKHLVMTDMKSITFLNNDFLSNNPKIESIEFANCSLTDFSFLKEVNKLKSLMVMNSDTTLDLQFIRNQKSLTRLSILINEGTNWGSITQCENLKWLALSGDISQVEFDAAIAACSELEVVEVIDCDSINNFAMLIDLRQLKALTVSDTLRDASTPLKLSNLEYLSVPESALDDSTYSANLREAIPNGIIVPNDGFCMGSGWFIFFIPAVLGITLLRKKLAPKIKTKHLA